MQLYKKIMGLAQGILPDSIRFYRKRISKQDNIRTGNWLKHKARMAYGRDAVTKGAVYHTNLDAWLIQPLDTCYRQKILNRIQDKYRFSLESMLVIRNPYEKTPLCALLLFETTKESLVRVTVKGKKKGCDFSFVTKIPASRHQVPVAGLYPGWENKVWVELLDEQGTCYKKKCVTIPTTTLPEHMSGLVEAVQSSEDTAMPFVFVTGGIGGSTYAFDRQGEIRYYLSKQPRQYGVYPQEDGRFLFPEKSINEPTYINPHANVMYDMDYLGRVTETYYVEGGLHHWVVPVPGTDGRIVLGAGSSMKKRMEDAIVRYNRDTGKIEAVYDLGALFLPTIRKRYDWAHLNRIFCVDRDHVIVSMRNCHTVAKLHLPSWSVVWILAHPDIYKGSNLEGKVLRPLGERFEYFYQQHAVEVIHTHCDKESTFSSHEMEIMLFDNHCTTKMDVPWFDKKQESYICFYEIDEEKATVRMGKRFACPLSPTRSNAWYDADRRRIFAMAGAAASVEDCDASRVLEWDYDTEELISDYKVYQGYFRAYPFDITDECLEQEIKVQKNYCRGELLAPLQNPKLSESDFQGSVLSESEKETKISLAYMDNLLLVRTQDHAVAKVYLVGDSVWEKDYTTTHQVSEVFAQKVYHVAVPVDRLPAGRYQIWLELAGGEMTDTGKWFEV